MTTPRLQWGRASSARKTHELLSQSDRDLRASMGPCFISTEDRCGGRGNCGQRLGASMGPCFISTEDPPVTSDDARLTDVLQWGRASSARKTWSSRLAMETTLFDFNGAVLHQHGRPSRCRRSTCAVPSTSMGPCFISTEDHPQRPRVATCGHTSMGPCFISTEDRRARESPVHRDRNFNGAVLHQHGRPPTCV